MSWKIDCAVVGPIQCNCYVLSETVSKQAYLIDPGAESKELLSFLERNRFALQAVLITHAHIDHIGGVEMIHEQFAAPVYYHGADRPLFEDVFRQARLFGVTPEDLQSRQPKVGEGSLQQDQTFSLQGGEIRVMHTPGHTPGSVCFHAVEEEPVVFSGDTLFQGSIGRTDLWGGSFEQIMESIRKRLLSLDDSVLVLPGHGPSTTIGQEKSTNPFILNY